MGSCLTKLSMKKNHSPFDALPEECISHIISFTSPRDACVAASVSKTFESTVQPDSVWEKFLPPEYPSLIPPSIIFSSKKELFFSLCNESFLIEDNKMRLWFDKGSVKKCFLLFDNNIKLSCRYSPEWILSPTYRFTELAEHVLKCQFKIHGVLNSRYLSPRTRYSAYVVCKREAITYRWEVEWQYWREAERQVWRRLMNVEEREDGWMEVEFGEFINDGELMDSLDGDEIEMMVSDIHESYSRRGLIVKGIELRPVK